MICTISKHAAEREGYADALMLDWRGYVAEATGANIFLVRDGVIHTPDARLLPRRHHPPHGDRAGQAQRASRWSSGTSWPRNWRPSRKCFITGTAAEVTPVGRDRRAPLHAGQISLSLMDDYARMVRRQLQPA